MFKDVNYIEQLRKFNGSTEDFWVNFFNKTAGMIDARVAFLMVTNGAENTFTKILTWNENKLELINDQGFSYIDKLAGLSLETGHAWKIFKNDDHGKSFALLGVCFELNDKKRSPVGVFCIENRGERYIEETLWRLKSVSNSPAFFQYKQLSHQTYNDKLSLSNALDLSILLNESKNYITAAMTLCNELSSRYNCERVCLGWQKGRYLRVQSISHMDKFDKKMNAVQELEAVMEEAFDQDEEIVYPKMESNNLIVKSHESYSREKGSPFITSLPLRLDGEIVGVLTCEKSEKPFDENDMTSLRLICDLAVRRLTELKEKDRWVGARMAAGFKKIFSPVLGVENTFLKLACILVFAGLVFISTTEWNYRVEAPFILETDEQTSLSAPFDGYIHEVFVEKGDIVDQGQILLRLDNSELLLEESTAIANKNRYLREAEKARAENELAEMKVALALVEQAQAQLEMIRYKLRHADIISPFKGALVEGDFKKLLDSPVRKGDMLFKIAKLENVYAELELDEKDIHEIEISATGEIAFESRPKHKYEIVVDRIDPVAISKEKKNVFKVRANLIQDPSGWWRPGMSGISKINVGDRNILWIFTHNTIDFFRILLWW